MVVDPASNQVWHGEQSGKEFELVLMGVGPPKARRSEFQPLCPWDNRKAWGNYVAGSSQKLDRKISRGKESVERER